jgi:site-specific DNA-methyltransferase (adenine-specific)
MKSPYLDIRNVDNMLLMSEYPDNHFDLAIVDPNYGRGEHGGTNRTKRVLQKNGTRILCEDGGYTKKKWDDKPPPPKFFTELLRVSKEQIIWGVNYFNHPLTSPGRIIWDKINDGSSQSDAEIAYCSLNERVDIVRYMWRGMMQGSAINATTQQGNKKLNEKRIHPTQKPVKLYEWLLEKYTKPGFKIIDTHLGSGSIAIACHYAKLHLTAAENDKEYFDESCERINRLTRQKTLF